ncbi:MAG: 6-phosphogluconolactonase [Thermoleophilaceae bacterium]|jgi:6-phosphogluconolactonase|nr:6-phosphogluconolactonase [Thermoleophilaceae bacterium]
MADIRIVDDPAAAAADLIADSVRAGGHIALTGGSTPRTAYERLAGMDLDWTSTTLWFGDERCVPPDHEYSNYRMAKEALLDRIEGDPPAVHRMPGEKGPHAGAGDYERELRETLGEQLPRLDLVLLGLGPDAHTASLFPNKPAVEVTDRAVVGVEEAGLEPFVPRITLTLPAINAGRRVLFLIAGVEKSAAVSKAFGGGEAGPEVPASLVTDSAVVLLDGPAASGLPR